MLCIKNGSRHLFSFFTFFYPEEGKERLGVYFLKCSNELQFLCLAVTLEIVVAFMFYLASSGRRLTYELFHYLL